MTGFHAEYEVISEEPSEAPGCTGEKLILTDARGEVTSPHHPNNYPDSQDCEYEIRVEAGKRIYLIFRTLELEDSTDCAKDYLEIFDPFNDKSRKLCGSITDMKYKTSGSRVILRFHTDSSGSASGYKLVYRTINKKIRGCHGIVNTSPATLGADNYPNRYRNRKNCLQEINAPAGQVIKISFEYIRIQNSNNCWKDYLKVKDFQDDGSVAEVTYCGDYEAFEWVSTTNLVVLKFHSNGSVRDDGYVANIQFANQ
ncbi:tolloid-like protein 1 [Glandiceps talaboti]